MRRGGESGTGPRAAVRDGSGVEVRVGDAVRCVSARWRGGVVVELPEPGRSRVLVRLDDGARLTVPFSAEDMLVVGDGRATEER